MSIVFDNIPSYELYHTLFQSKPVPSGRAVELSVLMCPAESLHHCAGAGSGLSGVSSPLLPKGHSFSSSGALVGLGAPSLLGLLLPTWNVYPWVSCSGRNWALACPSCSALARASACVGAALTLLSCCWYRDWAAWSWRMARNGTGFPSWDEAMAADCALGAGQRGTHSAPFSPRAELPHTGLGRERGGSGLNMLSLFLPWHNRFSCINVFPFAL